MNKYEISVWEDYFVPASGSTESHYEERKLCVIGSNTMTDGSRALEPNLVLNVNGTHTLTFKLYLSYIDTITGERIDNPFVKLLVNERKVKVYWDNGQEDVNDKWYDLVVKDISEDSDSNTVTYTCEDLFINELGKSGFELNFSDEANNNQGTIYELATAVLDGTDWQLDEENTDHLLQTQEEALYEVKITNMNALTGVYANGFLNITKDKYEKIPNNAICYLPYSMVPHSDDELADMTAVQFIYAPEYTTEYSSMLITNEDSNWLVTGGVWIKSGDIYQFKIPSSDTTKTIFAINPNNAFVSNQYRGNVYCRKQLSTYDANLERYVNVYKVKGSDPTADNKRIFGYVDYDYDASDLVNNLLSNNKDFKNTTGWIGTNLKIGLFPELKLNTDLTKYEGHSYLSAAIKAGQDLVNNTLSSAAQYLSSGLFEGMKVKFQIGLKDEFKDGTLSVAVVDKKNNSAICLGTLYEDENNPSNVSPIFTPLVKEEGTDSNGTVWYSGTLTCLKALAKNFLEDAELVIKSTNPKDAIIKIIETRLYELIHGKDKDGNDIILDLYDINSTDVAKKFYYYYYEDTSNPDGTAPYIYKAQVPCPLYEPVYGGWAKSAGATEREYSQFEKVRTIYGQQSNRFNLLQELAETFKCWARFKIYHNADGSIERDSNGKQKKTVYFSEKIGQQLSYGFTYGIDLNTIRRTQSSSELVTKTIVLANYNDNAPNGTCSIVDSEENYPRENFVLNFDYYVNHGLLDGEALNRDLYYSGAGNDYIGYYTKLHKYNIEYLSAADRAILLRNQEVRLLQQSVVYDGLLACAVKERDELIDELAALGGDTSGIKTTISNPKADDSDKSNILIEKKWIPIKKALEQIKQYVSKSNETGDGTTPVLAPSDQNVNLIKTIKDLDGDIATYRAICLKLDAALAALQLTIEANTANRDRLLKLIKELHQKFYNKYSNYIQEGSWTSEDYIDPNIYYYDALSVAYTSSRPQVQYDIAVTRVSELPEFKFRRFHVGDTTYIQDTDFFGYEPYLKNDKVRTPYKEAVLISEISINFEEPDKDTITVQNYKTQFEDLFQRINATTQSLQYAQGGYNRAAGVVNGKGELKEDILQDSLLAAQDIVTKATDESVVQDNTGLTLTSLKNLDQKLKITSGGIVFSDDGGETWTTMMKAGQIGVQFLSAGSISTSKITIMDGTTPAFRWDTNGITAYWSGKDYLTPTDNPVLKMNRFVRFDKFGIYGYNNGNDNDNTNFVPASEEEVRSNSMFSLTWSGLLIRSIQKDGSNNVVGSIEINNKYDIVVKKGDKDKVLIGRLNDNGNYGIRICDDDGKPVLETIDNGSLWLRQSLSIGTGTDTKVKIGVLDNDQVFNANDNFIVNKDGTAKMTGNLRIKGKYKDLLLKSFQEDQQYDDFCGTFLVPTTDLTGSQYEGVIGFSFDSNGTAAGVVQSPGLLMLAGNSSLEATGTYSMKAYSTQKAGEQGVGTMIGCGMPQPYQDNYSVSIFNSYDGMRFIGNNYNLKLNSYQLNFQANGTNYTRYPARLALRNQECTASLEVARKTTLGTYKEQVPTAEFCLFNTLSGEIAEQTPFSSADVRVRISSHPTFSNHIIINFYEKAKWLGTLHISNTEFVYDAAGQ